MKKILLLLFCCTVQFTFSQQSKIDSLYKEINSSKTFNQEFEKNINELCKLCDITQNDKNTFLCEISKVKKYYLTRNLNKVIKESKRLIKESNFIKKDTFKAYRCFNFIRASFYELRKADSVIYYSKKIIELAKTNKQKLYCLNKLSEIYYIKKDFKNSNYYLEKGLILMDSINDFKLKGEFYLNLGQVQRRLHLDNKALQNLFKSLELYKADEEISINTGNVYKEIARLKEKKGDFNEAKKYYLNALNDFRSIKRFRSESTILDDLCDLNINLKDFNKAFEYANNSFKLKQKHNYVIDFRFTYSRLGRLYYLIDNPQLDKSIYYLNKAKIGYSKIKERSKIEAVELYLFNAYLKKKDIESAKKHIKEYIRLKDSLEDFNTQKLVAELDTKYQTEKKEKENLQLKADNAEQVLSLEKEKNNKWFLGTGLFSVSLLSLVFWRKYKSEEKAKKIITLQKDEIVEQKEVIETLQKDLHHRVKNNLAIINRFIDVVKDEFNDDAFDSKLIELQNRISSINEVHQQLYNNEDTTKLGVKKYIEKLKQNIENTFSNENISVEQNIDDSVNFKADKSFPVGLIINEFLTNSFKYAFTDSKNGKITININESNDYYNLKLVDNGKGFPEGFDSSNSKTFGLRIMKLLTQQINGTFNIDGSNGVKLNIQFPK